MDFESSVARSICVCLTTSIRRCAAREIHTAWHQVLCVAQVQCGGVFVLQVCAEHLQKEKANCAEQFAKRDGGAGRSRTDLHGFAIRCITALLPRHLCDKKGKLMLPFSFGAGDESRTRDLNLGKVALYQLSYSRVESRNYSAFRHVPA